MKKISDRNIRSYHEQYWYAENVLEEFLDISSSEPLSICEIGPAEGGALKYFAQQGHKCFGIEFSPNRHENSLILNQGLGIDFIHGDITQPSTYRMKIPKKLDILICRDVIEHIDQPQKQIALHNMLDLLKYSGKCFISFPPKYSPYAGHQQTAPSILAKLPYVYNLPNRIYSLYLKILRIPEPKINGLNRVKSTRISIHRFESIVSKLPCTISKRVFYLIRPAHENRYRFKRLVQPFNNRLLREWLSTGVLYCLKKK